MALGRHLMKLNVEVECCMGPQRWNNWNVSLGAYHVPPMQCLVRAGGVIPGAMNSQLSGLAVSWGGVRSQTSKYMLVIVGLSVGTPHLSNLFFLMIALSNAVFCFLPPYVFC